MKIIGYSLSKLHVERKDVIDSSTTVSQNIDIKEVIKEKVSITNNDALRLKFAYIVDYSKESAKIEIEGNLTMLPDKKEMDEFLKSWKSKKIPDSARVPLFNFIMGKCNIKALAIEDEFNLPIHLPMPKLTFQDKKKD